MCYAENNIRVDFSVCTFRNIPDDSVLVKTNMAAALIGNINEFVPGKEDWSTYQKRFEIWLKANKIPNEDRVNVFLAVVGSQAFELLESLKAPADVSELGYDVLVEALVQYYQPVRNEVFERQCFERRNQKEGETISEYVLALKRLARHCSFRETLNERLRDKFVGGVRSAVLQCKVRI